MLTSSLHFFLGGIGEMHLFSGFGKEKCSKLSVSDSFRAGLDEKYKLDKAESQYRLFVLHIITFS